ncbi:MAG: DNA-binding protein, partial [Anaerolineae bacterium]
ESEHILDEAQQIGHEYGHFARQAGLPLTDAIAAAMFFRDTLMEVALELPSTARIQPGANVRLMRRINELLNTVHLAIAETYEAHHE